jgi:hypothetical protein
LFQGELKVAVGVTNAKKQPKKVGHALMIRNSRPIPCVCVLEGLPIRSKHDSCGFIDPLKA